MELAPVYVLRPNSARSNAGAKGLVLDTGPGRSPEAVLDALVNAPFSEAELIGWAEGFKGEYDGAEILDFPAASSVTIDLPPMPDWFVESMFEAATIDDSLGAA